MDVKEKIYFSFKEYSNRKFSYIYVLWTRIRSPEFRYIYHLIYANYYLEKDKFRFWYHNKIIKSLKYKYGICISPKTKIGKGFVISHAGGIVINHCTEIGNDCWVRQNTTIGNDGNNNENSPIIGNNVDIGANSVIIGKVRIGNNVKIGAGSVVVKDLPDNSVCVGNPCRPVKIYNKDTNSWERIK